MLNGNHESYRFISTDPKYVDGNKLLWSEMPSDVSEAVFKEIDWQLSEDVTWIEDLPDWEIVKIEPQAWTPFNKALSIAQMVGTT